MQRALASNFLDFLRVISMASMFKLCLLGNYQQTPNLHNSRVEVYACNFPNSFIANFALTQKRHGLATQCSFLAAGRPMMLCRARRRRIEQCETVLSGLKLLNSVCSFWILGNLPFRTFLSRNLSSKHRLFDILCLMKTGIGFRSNGSLYSRLSPWRFTLIPLLWVMQALFCSNLEVASWLVAFSTDSKLTSYSDTCSTSISTTLTLAPDASTIERGTSRTPCTWVLLPLGHLTDISFHIFYDLNCPLSVTMWSVLPVSTTIFDHFMPTLLVLL